MFILGVTACDLVKSKNVHLIDGLKQLFKKKVWILSVYYLQFNIHLRLESPLDER
jgi:hypothetical protein